jgi:alkanesulfonate monooxygenase SsuD/methylene tetrahydromethanopterin reductase-like flavin-dependent oxidoreductase (luciferase family)
LREELEIMRGMWTQDRTTVQGAVWQVEEAINQPKPISQPHPEVLIGFKAPKLVAPIVAEFATRANVFAGDDAALANILDVVRAECTRIGRRFEDIVFSRCASLIFTDGPVGDRDKVIEERARTIGMNPEFLAGEHAALLSYVGPVAGCADHIHAKTAAMGIEEVIVLIDTIDKNSWANVMAGLRVFARDVLPDLQSRGPLVL